MASYSGPTVSFCNVLHLPFYRRNKKALDHSISKWIFFLKKSFAACHEFTCLDAKMHCYTNNEWL